jgi:hypothetical protein
MTPFIASKNTYKLVYGVNPNLHDLKKTLYYQNENRTFLLGTMYNISHHLWSAQVHMHHAKWCKYKRIMV